MTSDYFRSIGALLVVAFVGCGYVQLLGALTRGVFTNMILGFFCQR